MYFFTRHGLYVFALEYVAAEAISVRSSDQSKKTLLGSCKVRTRSGNKNLTRKNTCDPSCDL